ncbi:hypothetical protein M0R45_034694 [Rubus argutus]|uniref:AN1-type domain-containing protein n=1 Tax=Rubus argutus TaxID=59490 RepID=A0AAW1VUH2_RUBAR
MSAMAMDRTNLTSQVLVPPTSPPNSPLDDHQSPTPVTVSASNFMNYTGRTRRTRCPCCNLRLGVLGCHCCCGGVFCGEHRAQLQVQCVCSGRTHPKIEMSGFS